MEKEWTVIFLVYADFLSQGTGRGSADLRRELTSMINDLKRCKLHNQMEVILIQNIINPSPADGVSFDTTVVSRLSANPVSGQNDINPIGHPIPTLRASQKACALAEIFHSIHSNGYAGVITKAKKYFLVTWDHGSAFGIFRRNRSSIDRTEISKKTVELRFHDLQKTATPVKQETTVKVLTPLSFYKDAKGVYQVRKRNWEDPIYQFSTYKKDFRFTLNSGIEAEQALINLLTQKQFRDPVTIIKNGPSISFEIDETIPIRYFRLPNKNISMEKWSDDNTELLYSSGMSRFSFTHGSVELSIKEIFEKSFSLKTTNARHTFELPITSNKILDVLTNEEINTAIQSGFSDKPGTENKGFVNVLLMMNCSMMNVHSCYALKDSVEFLVAPQGDITEPGYNYEIILKSIYDSLESKKAIVPDTLAKVCVQSSGYGFPGRDIFKSQIDTWAIFAMKLEGYEKVCDLINEMCTLLTEATVLRERFYYLMRLVRSNCVRFDGGMLRYFMIDLSHFLSNIIAECKREHINADILVDANEKITRILSSITIDSQIGENLYPRVSTGMYTMTPLGLSIYFPTKMAECDEYLYFVDPKSKNQSIFLKEKKNWFLFLEKFAGLGII